MLLVNALAALAIATISASANNSGASKGSTIVKNDDQIMAGRVQNGVPAWKREHFMREANNALFRQSGECPFAAYGTIIVNHTDDTIVCEGANFRTGDPTIHGEISAINACTKVFEQKGWTPTQIFAAWGQLSIYTNAESCPMCASAIRWAGFKEYIYGTTIQHNYDAGWGVMTLSSYDVFQESRQLPGYQTLLIGQVLTNETDPLFSWQYDESAPCPNQCHREFSETRGYTICTNSTNGIAKRGLAGRFMFDGHDHSHDEQ